MNWNDLIKQEKQKPYFQSLMDFVEHERQNKDIYPPREDVFRVFDLAFDDVKVVILGQDPYYKPGQAMGYSFSVHANQALPKSLVNIFKELQDDLGIENKHGDLSAWARQGVFMLNTILTVEKSQPMSHAKKGWETFTDAVLKALGSRKEHIVFILWGKPAQTKMKWIADHHSIIASPHPSPLGAYRGFWKSKPFSKANACLIAHGQQPIDWRNYV